MTDYGTDLRLVGDDIVFTADGDVEVVSGPAMAAQDIDQTLKAVPGSIYWDREAGSVMPLFLNDSEADAASVIAELERAAIADPRVDPDSVKARQIASGKFRLEFTPLAAVKAETLEYDLAKGRE
jgi:phage baseplate assembly protein W